MADPILAKPSGRIVFAGLPNKIFASPSFQRIISKVPILRRVARQEGEALFDLVMGFVQSQALYALVKLKTLERIPSRCYAIRLIQSWRNSGPMCSAQPALLRNL